MGRRSRTHTLGAWMNGEYVGRWSINARGEHEFEYASDWVSAPHGRPISLSLPLIQTRPLHRGAVVANYFDNLLPESARIRARIQQRFGAPSQAPFDLLAEVGRDCVGALQLLPEGRQPGDARRIEAEPVDATDIERMLLAVPTLGRQQDPDDFRISIAGVQEKTALLLHGGRWLKPRGATPTTHILKLPVGRHGERGIDLTMSIENEWLCARILEAYGIRVATCWPALFGEQRVLIVERFDRRLSADGTWLMRLPQEDMCQAMGMPPDSKYQSSGGPGIEAVMDLLLGCAESEADRTDFFKTQVVFWLLAAIDGHAKNFSIFLEAAGAYRLTPRYDILSAYPVLGSGPGRIDAKKARMSMALVGENRHYRWAELSRRHLESTAKACGVAVAGRIVIDEVIAATPAVIARVDANLPAGFPESVSGPILAGLEGAARRIEG